MKKIVTLLAYLSLFFGNIAFGQYSLNFDGSNDYVRVNNYTALQTSATMTVEAWINADTWKTPLYRGTVVSTSNNVGMNNGFDLRAGENGKAEFNISIGGTMVSAISPAVMQVGQWYHLAGVYTGDSVQIFINGVMRAATPISGTISYSVGNLYVGECPGFPTRTFDGKIDEVRFWNTARTKSQLTNTICVSLAGNETGLVGYWKFDANNGTTTAVNSVSGGNSGTLVNMTLASAWAVGDYICAVNNIDVGVYDIITPATGFNLSAAEQVKVQVNNYCNQTVSNVPVSYKLGANAPVSTTIPSIPPFGSYTCTFGPTINLSAFQTYSLKSYTTLGGDVAAVNDSVTRSITNYSSGTNFAVNFDGVDDKIVINDAPDLNPTTALTIEAWIYAVNWKNAIHEGTIIGKDQGTPDRGYVLRSGSNGRMEFQISDNGSWKSVQSPAGYMKTNRWYHVAGVFDGSYVYLYVNGEMVSSLNATVINSSTSPLLIGESPGWAGRVFDGRIDEVRIWNIARSTAQIQANMSFPLAGNETGLVAYYKLNEGLNATAGDGTSLGHTGTLTNFASLPAAWVGGYSLTYNDIGVTGLVAPNNLTAFAGTTRVKAEIKNFGANTLSNIPIRYRIGTGPIFLDTVKTSIPPNGVYVHGFNKIEDLSALTTSSFTVRVKLTGDIDARNDSVTTALTKPPGATPDRITAFSGVLHNFAAAGQAQYAEVLFPEAPEKYNQVLMNISLTCPGTGCDPWDQAGKISLFKNGYEYELGRFVTPYGKACGPWIIDVTDFKTLLTGRLTLKSFIQVWGASGWLLNVSFDFIKGTSTYPYTKVTSLWNNDYLVYGDPGISYNLPVFTTPINANAKNVTLRTTLTGHGQGNTENAAEFCQKTHNVSVNGTNQFSHYLWKTDCGSNTCNNQSGTWTLSRAGWCPGQGVTPRWNDLTTFVTAGQNAALDYILQTYTNALNTGYDGNSHTEPYYRIHSYLVQKSDLPANFTDFTNGSPTQITSPPVAQSLGANEVVRARIKNKGTLPIVNPTASYFLNGALGGRDTIFQTILPGDSILHTFTQTADMSVTDNYVLQVLLTAPGDMNATDDITTLFINQITGINDLTATISLTVMPNPSNGEFNVYASGVEGKVSIQILDLQGRKVLEEEVSGSNGSFHQIIDLRQHPQGMYFLLLKTEKGVRGEKIVWNK